MDREGEALKQEKKMILKILIEEHREKFGKEPVIADMDLRVPLKDS
ncbi:MAG: hypothetical protein PHO65_01165 [Sulfurovum sp.]|nr:hypothetical protein [Sulfurovum sp.]